MARILIAEDSQADSFTQNLLKARHELVVVTTMSQAATTLRSQLFDMIIIDLHFDESRMFDAMQLVKTILKNADRPIICVGNTRGQVNQPFVDSVDFTARAMGAWMFLYVQEYSQTGDPKQELLRVIERCLAGDARKATGDARVNLHKQRVEIQRLRLKIENEEWSEAFEERLVELRRKLTALLVDVCDLNIGSIAQQEQIDESRNLHDRVSESVVMAEDKATRAERKQTLDELHHAVDEFGIAEREEEAAKKRGKRKKGKEDE